MITYKVWIPKLTNEEYSNLQKSIEQLVGFISQWFIPFDTRCVIELKTNQRASLNSEMLLNYNTRLSL
jgi:hypothetical protein